MTACHTIAFICGFLLDMLIGDPHFIPHPIRLIGALIDFLDKKLHVDGNSDYVNQKNLRRGRIVVAVVILVTCVISGGLLAILYYVNIKAGVIIEAVMTWQILAVKSLKTESMKVYEALKTGDIEKARKAVSMLVARDTEALDEEGVTKAAVETVAENTCDGVIAPMLFLAVGGPVLGFAYKAVSTMDSMIGYKNERYLYFGRSAAKLDDILNFLPSRIAAKLMIYSSAVLALDSEAARKIHKRDAGKTESPNAGQTESVCAGALGIALGGDTPYFGKIVKKSVLGDAVRPAESEDIKSANELTVCTAVICAMSLFIIMAAATAVKIWIWP